MLSSSAISRVFFIGFVSFLFCGCSERSGAGRYSSDGVVESHGGNRLVESLYEKGALPSATGKLVVRGSEGGFGADVVVTLTDAEVISRAWQCILSSENYGVYSACGYRKIEFHEAIDSNTPVVTLTLLCGVGDPAYLEEQEPFVWDADRGGRDGLYQCRGLNALVEPYLRDEHNRMQQEQHGTK